MPPPKSHKTLSEKEKQLLIRWIREGAKYEPHWSFVPAVRPKSPAVKDSAWVRNPIDHFILARLERTNTPRQALVTLNDPQFVEAARHLAQQAISLKGKGFEDRLRLIGMRILSRNFRPEEVEVIRQSSKELAAFYAKHPEAAAKLLKVGESKPPAKLDPVELAYRMQASVP